MWTTSTNHQICIYYVAILVRRYNTYVNMWLLLIKGNVLHVTHVVGVTPFLTIVFNLCKI